MLDVVLLGEFRVRSDGRLLSGLRSPRTQALLAYLAIHRGTPQARQRVANLFWPDSTEAQARTNLRRELHHVRNGLPQPDAVLGADQLSLWWREDAAARIDVAGFETAAREADAAAERGDPVAFVQHAATAVGAYGGDLLPGFYDDWVLAERERLHRRCVSLLDRLTAADTLADRGLAVSYARRRVDLEPLEEVGHRNLIDLLARSGDRGAALQAYHRCVTVLERELDAEPSPATNKLYARLFSSGIEARAEATVPAVRQRSPLVGRDQELHALRASWAEIAAGGAGSGARLVMIGGEAGIGKSRLADELLAEVRRTGGAVARARCFAGEHSLPLAPVSEWLRSDVFRSAIERLPAAWRAEVARLVPEIAVDDHVDSAGPAHPGDSWQRHRFFDGLVRAVLAVDHPLALLVDDLQWCDLDTLTWLELCFHTGAETPLMVVATSRSEEVDDNAELVAALSRLRAAGQVTDVELGPLATDQTAALAAQLLGRGLDDVFADRLQALTGGFPLFVIEAVHSHVQQGPAAALDPVGSPRVNAVLERRLSQLSGAASELAGLAAAVGRDFSLDLLTGASDLGSDRVVDALDELWRRRIVREHSAVTYDFSHDLLRMVAYDTLSPPLRRRLHRRVAQTLEAQPAGSIDAVASQIADQYDRARMPGKAVPYHLRATQAAARMFAYQEAVRLGERALAVVATLPAGNDRDDRELELRMAVQAPRNALGGWTSAAARDNVERILILSKRTGNRPVTVASLAAMWGSAFVAGRLADALALAEQAAAAAAEAGDLAAYGHLAMAGSLTSDGQHQRALSHFGLATSEQGYADLGLLGFAPSVMAWAWGAHACWLTGRVDEARARSGTAVKVAEELAVPFGRAVAVAYAAITHQLLGERSEMLASAVEIKALCARYEFAYYQHWGEVLEGWAAGGAAGAAKIAGGLSRLRAHGVGSRLPYYLALLAETLLNMDRPGEAAKVLAEAHAEAERHADRWWLPELWRLQARLDPGPAGADRLRQAVSIAREQGATSLALRAAVDLAARITDGADAVAARDLVASLRASCVGGSPELQALDARMDALTAEALGR
jgi:DNA-binding SARP family transcriptional activator